MAPAWLRLAALVVAAAPHLVAGADLVDGANEKYVIQAFDYEHAGAIDAASPDGASTVALTEGAASTRVDYAVARTGKRKGVAQMDDGRCAPVAGVVFDASRATRTIVYGHRECCKRCRDDPTCVFFSVKRGKEPTCLLFSDAPVLRLAHVLHVRASGRRSVRQGSFSSADARLICGTLRKQTRGRQGRLAE